MKLKRFFIVAVFALLLPLAGHAVSIIEMINRVPGMKNCATTGPTATPIAGTDKSALTCNSLDTILVVFAVAAQWLLGITGSVVLLMFVWGGAEWIFSAGSSKMVESGKKKMTGAVIGMTLVFGALAIVRTIRVGLKVQTVKCVIDADCPKTTACTSDPSACNVCSVGQCKPASSVSSGGGTIQTPGACTTNDQCIARNGPGWACVANACTKLAVAVAECSTSDDCSTRGKEYACTKQGGIKKCIITTLCGYDTQTSCEKGISESPPNTPCLWTSSSCASRSVTPPGQNGAVCSTTDPRCSGFLLCVRSVPVGGGGVQDVCTDHNPGSPCDMNASPSTCNYSGTCVNSRCTTTTAPDGAVCQTPTQCQSGFCQNNICTSGSPVGAACVTSDNCGTQPASAYYCNGTCQTKKLGYAICATNLECQSNSCRGHVGDDSRCTSNVNQPCLDTTYCRAGLTCQAVEGSSSMACQ